MGYRLTLDSLLGESFPPSLCFRGFRILVDGMCHLASISQRDEKKQSSIIAADKYTLLDTIWTQRDSPADLVLSRVGSLSL